MEFVNKTSFPAGWTGAFAPDGREQLVVVVKGTFVIPRDGEAVEVALEQVPLVQADEFTGEPGMSAVRYETDYAHRKPMCDVLLNGSAYAPGGKPTTQVGVGMRVGQAAKAFNVVGSRVWRRALGVSPASPQPFDVMPVSYDNAFGGTDMSAGDPGNVATFLPNPVGQGYAHHAEHAAGRPLPNTEERNAPVISPTGRYRPMAFGSIGRQWPPRVEYIGTYDDKWQQERRPFWPDDFDDRYFQSAPPDQQIPYPTGDEDVVLQNLTPDGHVGFKLPVLPMPVWMVPAKGRVERTDAVIDTIFIEPDLGRFTLTWRAVIPMAQSWFDAEEIVVGEVSEAWRRLKTYGDKPYYRGLAELVRARGRRV